MPATTELEAAVTGLFKADLHIAVPSPETDLLETGLLNSVTFVELVMLIEERLRVAVPLDDLDLERFRTVRRIAAHVASLSAQDQGTKQGTTTAA